MTKHRVHQAKTQQGLALPTVLLILTLASMAVLLAWRNLWLTDQLLNIEADRLRTQHKAEAALPLAVRDILSANITNSTHNITYSNTANTVADWQNRISSATPVPQNETPYGANTAWYWIESYAHTENALPLINPSVPSSSIYRVTVLATGVMPNSTLVLQTLWTSSTNQTTNFSWHVLRE